MADREVTTQEAPQPTVAPVAPETKHGPGEQALEALLKAGGMPDTKKVIAIIDGHRGERDALFAMLQSSLGNAYTQQVVAQMDKLRLSIDRKEIAAGDPSNPDGGFFVAGAEQQGAKWRTAGGGFSGTADKDGLDTTVKTNEHDAIHAHVGKDQSGTIAYERDGKSQGELFGHYKSGTDYEAGARKTWGLDGGSTLTTTASHQVGANGTTDALTGAYKSGDGKTTADGSLGVKDGQFAGSASGSHTRADGTVIAGALAHDGKTTSLDGSYTDKDTSYSGRLAHDDQGTTLSGAYKDKDTSITGRLGRDAQGTTTLGGTASQELKSGATVSGAAELSRSQAGQYYGSLDGAYKDKDTSLTGHLGRDLAGTTTLSGTGSQELKSGATIGGAAELHRSAAGQYYGSLDGSYKDKDTSLTGHLGRDLEGTTTLGGTGSHKLQNGATLAGSAELQRSAAGLYTGHLDGSYTDKDSKIDGSIVRGADSTTIGGGYTRKWGDELSLSARASHLQPDHGQGQSTFTMSEQYKSGKMIQGLDLTAGHGARDYIGAKGSIDAQLAPNLYAGAYGSFAAESGKQTTAQLGASLTFTPNEKTALTLAGVIDEHGTIETRLQYDVFKSKINGVSDIAGHKKDALVSLFLSYSQQTGGGRSLDDRYGAPKYGTSTPAGGGQVMAGIKIAF
ncbi:MAG: hypothetical protein NT062_04060 [Proteobacteria bacterium]|nr:hypothetical protein [Pseudomonadota bacterium]